MTNIPDHKVIVFNNQKITINPKQRLISVNILECYNIAIFEIGYTYGPKAFVKIDEQTYVQEKYLREFCEDFGREYIDVFNLRTNVETMSSLEIAQLTGKEHKDVMRDIRVMLEALGIDIRAQNCAVIETSYKAGTGKAYPMYLLNEELTLTLTSGYSIIQRNAIIKEWQAHRRGGMTPTVQQPAELSRKDLLLMALKSEEEKERLQFERDEAIKTKGQISTSREASIMGKLARTNEKVRQLEAKLAIVNQAPEYAYATVLAIQSRLKHLKVSGLKLTYYCNRNGLVMKDIPDERYGVVHSYPAQAWKEVYQIDINTVLNKVA